MVVRREQNAVKGVTFLFGPWALISLIFALNSYNVSMFNQVPGLQPTTANNWPTLSGEYPAITNLKMNAQFARNKYVCQN
jgi:hypothetical protein